MIYRGVEVEQPLFLALAQYGVQWSVSRSGRFTSGLIDQIFYMRKLYELHNRSGHTENEGFLVPARERTHFLRSLIT